MSVIVSKLWTEVTCDQCGKVVKKQGHFSYYIPRNWQRLYGKMLCGWKCVAAYAAEKASAPKPKPVKKKYVRRKKKG